jgi:hypothetical protein
MATFKDSESREWVIKLDAPTILSVRATADPEFLKGEAIETIERLRDDSVTLCVVVYALCKTQIADRKMTDEEFYKSVIGDAIDAATDALLDAILAFTPSRTRQMLETCAAKNNQVRKLAITEAMQAINDPATMERVENALKAEIEESIKRAVTRPSSATN